MQTTQQDAGRAARRVLAAGLALLLALSLAACAPAAPAAAQGAKELVLAVPGSISTLDTNQEGGILNYYIGAIVNDGLVALSNEGKPIPALAESWETADYAVWTFKLRANAKFSDGTPVTAEDIIWSIERAQDPEKSPASAIYFPDYVQAVEKTAEDTIVITLDGTHPSFIWSISNAGGLFVNKKAWGEAAQAIGSPQDLLLGSGPYRVSEFEPGSHVTLVASDFWWGGKPGVEKIRIDFIADDATRLLAFTQGDIDFALNIPVEQGEQWQKVAGATVEYFADRSYYGLTLDATVAPFDNEHVRRAVAYAVDAAGVVDNILKGHAQLATAITPPEQFASVLDTAAAEARLAGVPHYEYSIEKAKEEFAASGAAPFETTVLYPDAYQNVGKASLVVADALKDVGITLTVKEIPLDQWLAEVGDGRQGIAWMIYFCTTAEPAEIAAWLLDTTGPGYNPANWTDAEVAALTAGVLASAPEAGLDDLLAAHGIAQQQAFYVPVWWGESAVAYSGRIAVENFNSFTMLSQNWPQHFTVK